MFSPLQSCACRRAIPHVRQTVSVANAAVRKINGQCSAKLCLPKSSLIPIKDFHSSPDVSQKEEKLELPENNLMQRMYKKLFRGVPESRLKASGYLLMVQCTEGVDCTQFFETFDLQDTYYSWFLVTELHIWMMAARLMVGQTREGRTVRNAMVEALWNDCDQRAKLIGDMAMSVRSQQIVGLAEEFQATLFIYDCGVVGDDRELANALWRRFFNGREDVDAEKLELLVSYVRRTLYALENTDMNTVLNSKKLKWLKIKE